MSTGKLNASQHTGLPEWDYMSLELTDTVTETYRFFIGGQAGTKVATIVLVYTTLDKDVLSSITKTAP